VHGDALIVAGGANFPDKMPWHGGAKAWWDDIWVLEKTPGGATRWVADKAFKLPRKIGYGISVSTPQGVICVGGSDAERCYADVFLLSWDAAARKIRTNALPSLPQPLSMMAGALVGETLYVAGGRHVMKGAVAPTTVFWALDLSKRSDAASFKWTVLPSWPGPARVLPVAAAQRTDAGAQFFIFSGRTPRSGQPSKILADAYAFDPRKETWRTLPRVGGGAGLSVMAGTAAPVGDNEILLFGGDRGDLFLELESHDRAIEVLKGSVESSDAGASGKAKSETERHLAAKRAIYEQHPGFGREIFSFDPRQNTWRVVQQSPVAPQVTTIAVKWGDAIIIPSGEIRPGVRTPNVVRVVPVTR
jgi:cyclically-permuted mutarotase family protein